MNRRTFIAGGAAALALASNKVFGQVHAELLSGTTAVSDLTGAKLDLGRTGFELLAKIHDDDTGAETLTFSDGNCAANVRFVPAGMDTEGFLDRRAAAISDQLDSAEVVGSDVFDDGGWIAIATVNSDEENRATYIEFQVGAFADYDLEVYMNTSHDTVQRDLERIRGIVLEGMELFLFMEESRVETLDFSISSSSAGNSRGSTGKISRDSSTSESTNTGRSSSIAGDADPDVAIEAVREHQAQFMDELDLFYEVVDKLANEEISEVVEAELFGDLLNLMFAWTAYPDTASEVAFPSELASLEASYVEWSDGVGQMGVTMGDWMLGEGEIDAFLAAIDVAVQLNSALSAELRTLGVVIKPVGHGFPDSVEMRALRDLMPARVTELLGHKSIY